MASCEGRDSSVLSVPGTTILATASTSTTTTEGAPPPCEAVEAGKPECPPGWCRRSGKWRPTVDLPWGAPKKPADFATDPGPLDGPKAGRAKMRDEVLPKLRDLLTALAPHTAAYGADDEQRIAELKTWHVRLQSEK